MKKEQMVREMINATECCWSKSQKDLYFESCMQLDESVIERYYNTFKYEEELKKTSYFVACLMNA